MKMKAKDFFPGGCNTLASATSTTIQNRQKQRPVGGDGAACTRESTVVSGLRKANLSIPPDVIYLFLIEFLRWGSLATVRTV